MVDDFAATLASTYLTNTDSDGAYATGYANDLSEASTGYTAYPELFEARQAAYVARMQTMSAKSNAVEEALKAKHIADRAHFTSGDYGRGSSLERILSFFLSPLLAMMKVLWDFWPLRWLIKVAVTVFVLVMILGTLASYYPGAGRRALDRCWAFWNRQVDVWKMRIADWTPSRADIELKYAYWSDLLLYNAFWDRLRELWNETYNYYLAWRVPTLVGFMALLLVGRGTESVIATWKLRKLHAGEDAAFMRTEMEKARVFAASTTLIWNTGQENTPNARVESTQTESPWSTPTDDWLSRLCDETETTTSALPSSTDLISRLRRKIWKKNDDKQALTTSTTRKIIWPEDRETTTVRAPRMTATTRPRDVARAQELLESHASIVASIRGEALETKAKEEENTRKLEARRMMEEESNEAERQKEQTKQSKAAAGHEASKDSEEYDDEEFSKWTGFARWPSTIEEPIIPPTIFDTATQVTDLPSVPCTTVPPASPSSSPSTTTLSLFEIETRYTTTTGTITITIETGEEECGEETAARSEVITPEVWVGTFSLEESATPAVTLFQTTTLPPTLPHNRTTILEIGDEATAVGFHAYEDQPTMMEKGEDVHRNGRNLAEGDLAWCRECRQRHCCRVA